MATSRADQTTWKSTLQVIQNDPRHSYQKAAENLWGKVEKR